MSARRLLSVGEASRSSMLNEWDSMNSPNHLVLVRQSCGVFL